MYFICFVIYKQYATAAQFYIEQSIQVLAEVQLLVFPPQSIQFPNIDSVCCQLIYTLWPKLINNVFMRNWVGANEGQLSKSVGGKSSGSLNNSYAVCGCQRQQQQQRRLSQCHLPLSSFLWGLSLDYNVYVHYAYAALGADNDERHSSQNFAN